MGVKCGGGWKGWGVKWKNKKRKRFWIVWCGCEGVKRNKEQGSCDWLEKFERQNRSEKENYVYVCAGGGSKSNFLDK